MMTLGEHNWKASFNYKFLSHFIVALSYKCTNPSQTIDPEVLEWPSWPSLKRSWSQSASRWLAQLIIGCLPPQWDSQIGNTCMHLEQSDLIWQYSKIQILRCFCLLFYLPLLSNSFQRLAKDGQVTHIFLVEDERIFIIICLIIAYISLDQISGS